METTCYKVVRNGNEPGEFLSAFIGMMECTEFTRTYKLGRVTSSHKSALEKGYGIFTFETLEQATKWITDCWIGHEILFCKAYNEIDLKDKPILTHHLNIIYFLGEKDFDMIGVEQSKYFPHGTKMYEKVEPIAVVGLKELEPK